MRDLVTDFAERFARRIAREVQPARADLESQRDVYAAIAELRRRSGDASLATSELRVFSQNGEDGVLAEIFARIGTSSRSFVEFGVEDGTECNTRYLADVLGWSGLYIEAHREEFEILSTRYAARDDVHTTCAMVTPANVNDLIGTDDFDVLSIDVDGQDYWIWEAVAAKPRVVVIEYNAHLRGRTVETKGTAGWNDTDAFGASIDALTALAERKGYRLVHQELTGTNAFFVWGDLADRFPEPVLPRGANYYLRGRSHHPPGSVDFTHV